ncbi:MAG: hypothetical protein LBH30_00630 [Prevotellaceae bacterium]|jgi:hypothetical protein|nr:hypothetical protein [Prevotellaceae bacterium]
MKKVLKKVSFLGVVLMLFAVNVSAQKTAYEKRVEQIEKEAAQKLGYPQYNEVVAMMLLDGMNDALSARNTKKAKAFMWYADELEKAEKLKTPEEIRREKQEAEEVRRKSAEREKKEEEQRQQKYELQKEREKQEAYWNSDIGEIEKSIKEKFVKWSEKGELEKTVDYQERLKTQSQDAFVQICIEKINDRIRFLKKYVSSELLAYNADDEYYPISFTFRGLTAYHREEIRKEWEGKIYIPVTDAKNFKKNYWKIIDDYDWCLVENYLYPTLVTIVYENKKYEIHLQLQNQSEITFSFDNLGIDNPYLKNFVLEWATIKKIGEKAFAAYEQKLDSIFTDYNKQLLQNPFNINKTTMNGYEKMQQKGNQKENFEKNIERIKSDFEKLNSNFARELESKNPEEYFKVYYSLNPDKKTEADSKYLDCRCRFNRKDFDERFIKHSIVYRNKIVYGVHCGCREELYKVFGAYFADKTEFDKFYDQGEDIVRQEAEKRKIKRQAGSFEYLKQCIAQNKNESYYSELVDIAIENNKKLNKEWTKNGQFFANKTEFYEAFVSDNYKQILKDKKKK